MNSINTKKTANNTDNMSLQIFKNTEFGEIRTMTIDGEPWFVGKDVAVILGYAKPHNALTTHVDDDDSLKQGLTDSLGRTQETIFINESGLYSLILSSKLPTAKKFKHWITSEVLPSIRIRGSYNMQGNIDKEDLKQLISDAVVYALKSTDSTTGASSIHLSDSVESLKSDADLFFMQMCPKYSLIEKHLDISRRQLYKALYEEMQERYNFDLNEVYAKYLIANRCSTKTAYQMDAIVANPTLKAYLIALVDELLVKCGLSNPGV